LAQADAGVGFEFVDVIAGGQGRIADEIE